MQKQKRLNRHCAELPLGLEMMDKIRARIVTIENVATAGIQRAYTDNPRAYSQSGWQMLIESTYCQYIVEQEQDYYLLNLGYATYSVLDFVKYQLHINGLDDVQIKVA